MDICLGIELCYGLIMGQSVFIWFKIAAVTEWDGKGAAKLVVLTATGEPYGGL